jgi:hypothetical protein
MNCTLGQRGRKEKAGEHYPSELRHTKSGSAKKAGRVPYASAGSEIFQMSVPERFQSCTTTTNTLP